MINRVFGGRCSAEPGSLVTFHPQEARLDEDGCETLYIKGPNNKEDKIQEIVLTKRQALLFPLPHLLISPLTGKRITRL